MLMYHGTSLENWKLIQDEGVLWGVIPGYFDRRRTYLATDYEEAECYGDVVLEVDFDPNLFKFNNYCDGCWQCRVYCAIPLNRVKRIK